MRCRAFVVVLGLLAGLGAAYPAAQVQVLTPTEEQGRTADIEVSRLVSLLRLEPGAKVADVGAGLGAWSVRFARWTGASGHVFSTEIDEVGIVSMRALMAREGISNMTILRGAIDSTNLPAACCEGILVRNVFHYFTEPDKMIQSLAASLKPGGRLAIVDFPPRPNSVVPPGVPANRGGNGVPPAVVEAEVGAVLRHITTVPNWSPEAMPPRIAALGIAPSFVAVFEKPR